MTKPTQCSIEQCERDAHCKGWCKQHYERWQVNGTPHRACRGCGSDIPIKSPGGYKFCGVSCRRAHVRPSRLQSNSRERYIRRCITCGNGTPSNRGKYCSPECRAVCASPNCGRTAVGTYCDGHSQRKRKYGTVVLPCTTCGLDVGLDRAPRTTCSDECDPECIATGCSRSPWNGERCATHEARARRETQVAEYRASGDGRNCAVCEKPLGTDPRQKYCSTACLKFGNAYSDIAAALSKTCGGCGEQFSLFETLEGKARRRVDANKCLSCSRRNFHIFRVHRDAVIERSGTDCALCGRPIDMTLSWPHKMSFSIDHIIPWSLGGSHDLTNLQPSHLICNATKQARAGFTIG